MSSPDEEGIPFEVAERIALHAIGRGHELPGYDLRSPSAARAYAEYVYEAGKQATPHEFDDGTRVFYDARKDAVIIYNPNAPENSGTVFAPVDRRTGASRGLRYYLDVIRTDRSPTF